MTENKSGRGLSSDTYRDIIEKLIIPKITAGMFTESPADVVDGTRTIFTTTREFYEGTLAVYINGARVHPSEYKVTSNKTITFNTAPTAGYKIMFDYVPTDI